MASKKWAMTSTGSPPVGYESTTYTTATAWSAAEGEDVTAYGSAGDHAYLEIFDDFSPQLNVGGASWIVSSSDGWVTDADNYIVVRAADGEGHGGTIGGGLSVSTNTDGFKFVSVDFLLQDIEADGVVCWGQYANSGKCQIDRCIVVGGKLVKHISVATNCLCIDNSSSGGIDLRSGFSGEKAINCTSDGHSSYGVYGDNESGGHFSNCVVTNSNGASDPFYNEGAGADYNATDYSATTGANSITSIVDTDNYTNLAANDYSIKDTNADIYDAGTDLSSTYPELAYDIAGNPRTSTYSIGAYEYAAAGGGVEVALTGLSAAASIGALAVTAAINVSVGLTGISSTGDAGTLSVSTGTSVNQELTGNSASASVGTLGVIGSIQVTEELSGVSATAGIGTLGVSTDGSVSVQPIGVGGTSAVGTLAVTASENISETLTGAGSTGAVGTLSVVTGLSVTPSGVSATGSAGTLGVASEQNIIQALTGIGSTGSVGTLTITVPETVSEELTGVGAVASAGTLTVSAAGMIWTEITAVTTTWTEI